MPDPAASFKSWDASLNARAVQNSTLQSGLYVAHKDWTKPMDRPNTVQEVIDGDETNAQYCVRLGVPAGATHVALYWVSQVNLSVSTASLTVVNGNIAGIPSSYHLRVHGRIPTMGTGYSYSPSDAALSNAIAVNSTYGLWKPLFNIALSTGAASEIHNYGSTINYGIQYASSSTRRMCVTPIFAGGSGYMVSSVTSSVANRALATVGNGDTGSATWSDPFYGTIPLRGSTELLIVPEYFGTYTSTSLTASVSGGTGTVDYSCIGATFHS